MNHFRVFALFHLESYLNLAFLCTFCLERMYECRKEETSETYECFHCECFSFREIPFPIDGNELVLYDVTIGNAEVAVPYSIFRMFNQESNE